MQVQPWRETVTMDHVEQKDHTLQEELSFDQRHRKMMRDFFRSTLFEGGQQCLSIEERESNSTFKIELSESEEDIHW